MYVPAFRSRPAPFQIYTVIEDLVLLFHLGVAILNNHFLLTAQSPTDFRQSYASPSCMHVACIVQWEEALVSYAS
jgi:hypothetical protein